MEASGESGEIGASEHAKTVTLFPDFPDQSAFPLPLMPILFQCHLAIPFLFLAISALQQTSGWKSCGARRRELWPQAAARPLTEDH